ncbi:MAG TPA: diguanylate cyclase, partial [Candidatus Sulfotelmatobacter sp.]|nr:diguanylate cyclase [Candidatus Sulfotelmatobacter sp.]
MKLLLTDGDAASRRRTRDILEREGYQVCEAEDGKTATELLSHAGGPRLLVLDLMNPAVDGAALCRFVRNQYGRPYVYIILLASNETQYPLACGLQAGADDHLRKPFDLSELKARLAAGRRILALEDKLLHEARHDSLTQLPNRKVFLERVEACVSKARQQRGYNFAVLVLDIDRFKNINASLGNVAGDELMIQLSRRLAGSIRLRDPNRR